jgi:hypothetical protein
MLISAAPSARAEKPRPAKPTGTWEHKVGDTQVKLQVRADSLHFSIIGAGVTIDVDADYGVTRDGTLFGIITKVKAEGTDRPPTEGKLFSFHVAVANNVLTVKDLKGTDNGEARQLVEGEYKKANGKEKGQ